MIVDELITMLGKDHFFPSKFAHWIELSDPFKTFSEKYQAKILKKTNNEKGNVKALRNLLLELEMAYLMLKDGRFSVEYESCGDRGPDFTVIYEPDKTTFYVEVTRIRELDIRELYPQVRFEEWKECVLKRVCAEASMLACRIHLAEANSSLRMQDRWDENLRLLDRLINNKTAIIDYIINTAHTAEDDIAIGETKAYSVPNFTDGEIRLEFNRPPDNVTRTLDCYFGSYPLFKKGNEWRIFESKFVDKLRNQVISGKTNVLVISSDSKVHNAGALLGFIVDELNKRATEDNTKEGNTKRGQLWSGVLFRGCFVPIGCKDPNYYFPTNDFPISKDIRQALRELD